MPEVAKAYVAIIPSYKGGTAAIARQMRPSTDAAGREGGERYGGAFKTSATKVFRGIGKSLAAALAVGTIAVASSALAGMAGQGIAVAGALSSAAGAAALIPAFLAGGVAVIGALKIGTQGIGDAFKALATGDVKKIDKAVANLSPNARAFVTSIRGAMPALAGIKNSVQDGLFAGLGPVFAKALTDLGPIAKTGFTGVSSALNASLRSTFAAVDNAKNLAGIQSVFQSVAVALRNASAGAAPLVNSIVRFTATASQSLPRVGTGFANLSKSAGAFIDRIASDGTLNRWIDTGITTLSTLAGVIRNVGSILTTVLSAGATQGQGLVASFKSATGTLAEFLKSADGQKALAGFFASAAAAAGLLGPILRVIAPLLTTLSGAIGPLAQQFGPILVDVIRQLTPGFTAVVAAIGPFVTNLGPTLVTVATALSDVLVALAPVLPQLATLIANIVTGLTPFVPLMTAAASATGPLVEALSGIAAPAGTAGVATAGIAAGFSALKDTASSVGEFVGQVKEGVGQAKEFATGVKNFASATKEYISLARQGKTAEIARAKALLASARASTASAVASVRAGAATAVMTARTVASRVAITALSIATRAWAAAQVLLNLAMSANPLVLVVAAIAALVAIVVIVLVKFGVFRTVVQAVFGAVVAAVKFLGDVFRAVFGFVAGLIGTVVGFIRSHWQTLVAIFLGPIGFVVGIVVSNFTRIRNFVAAAINGVLAVVSAVLGVVRGVFSAVWGAISGVVAGAVNFVRTAVSNGIGALVGIVRSIGGGIAAVWSNIWNGLKDTVTNVVRAIGGVVSSIWNGVTSGLKSALNGGIRILNGAINLINDKLIDTANIVPGVNIPHIPKIPELAKGGIVQPRRGGTIVRVAEAGQAEAVIPLDKLAGLTGGGNAAQNVSFVINEVTDPVGTAHAVARRLARLGAA